jgi:hypothetical protein
MTDGTRAVEHIDANDVPRATPATNPLAKGLNVTVSIPDTLEIRMVDASALEEYEVWVLVASILASAAVGFTVAYVQDSKTQSLFWNAVVFGALFGIALATAFMKRHRLRRNARRIYLNATEVTSPRDHGVSEGGLASPPIPGPS